MKTVAKYLLLILLLTTLQSCMVFKYNFVSPGRIKPKEYNEYKKKFKRISNEISSVKDREIEVIAHGAGSWRYYPMGISKNGTIYGNGFNNKRTKALNINEIIDSTLIKNPEVSIELDVHYAPENSGFTLNKDKGYIIHDRPKWDKEYMKSENVKKYLNENTLVNFLNHFTKNNYFLKSNVYIEIKVCKECDSESAPESCTFQYKKLAKELRNFAIEYKRKDQSNWLNITSFSPSALQSFRNEVKSTNTQELYDYVLITGYTGGKIKKYFAQTKGYVPKFDKRVKDFASNTEWLNTIWFSVRGIKGFKNEFNSINNIRNQKFPDFPLSYSYATYEKKQKSLIKALKKGKPLKANIRSFMIDIDDKDVNYTNRYKNNSIRQAKNYNIGEPYESNALIRKFWGANKLPSYVSVPYITPIKDRRIPTTQGEGTNNLQLLEAYIDLSFPLFYGKELHNKLISLEYTTNFRMTLDDSKPLTPASNHIGLSYYSILNSKFTEPDILDFLTTRIQLKHYSNGQEPGFYYFDPNNPSEFRNSYQGGDFSTNYLWLQLTRGKYIQKLGSLHQISGGYRYDMGTEDSTFAYTQEQENSYGRHRLTFSYDYRTVRFNEAYEHHFRLESDYIFGNLDRFSPNLVNDANKYRFNVKAMYEFAPKNHYSVGYFISAYYGRDNLNIRFDDIIFSVQAGITLNLNKLVL